MNIKFLLKSGLIFVVALFVLGFSGVFAADNSSAVPSFFRERIKDATNLKNELQQRIDGTPLISPDHQARERARILKEELQNRQEGFELLLQERKERLQEAIEAKRNALKERLQKIKNERKRKLVETIDQRLDALNKKYTDHLLQVLVKLEDALIRIGERTANAAEKNVDISAVNTAVDEAKSKISEARNVVAAQSDKTYTINVSDEANLKIDVGAARQDLHEDLVAAKEAVKVAKEAVHKAAVALAHAMAGQKVSPTPK